MRKKTENYKKLAERKNT